VTRSDCLHEPVHLTVLIVGRRTAHDAVWLSPLT
jgi:hypothetical protein